ncbi:hypothetical protein ACWOBW_00730 [Gemella sanguinis]
MHRGWNDPGISGGKGCTISSYVNRIVKKKEGVVNKTFVQMMETLGYDIELTFVKRK